MTLLVYFPLSLSLSFYILTEVTLAELLNMADILSYCKQGHIGFNWLGISI